MTHIRPAAVAGQFYPAEAATLQQDLTRLLSAATSGEPCPKAIIAPHAGYIYSGPCAATVYARVRNGADRISRVILFGPGHRLGFSGIAASSADYFDTPLGQVRIDAGARERALALPQVRMLDEAHQREHSLEVHLPFLQCCLNEFTLCPLLVGDTDPAVVADVIEALWGGAETLIIFSSDMSHFLPYEEARAVDSNTTRRITQLHPDITGEQACGCRSINGLLEFARRRALEVELLDRCNSGDTAGTRDRVVGYAAFIIND